MNERIKIIEPGWGGYNGYVGRVEFKDGISVGPVSQGDATQLGSILRIEACDSGDQVGAGQDAVDIMTVSAPILTPSEGQAEPYPQTAPEVAKPKFTREELEKVADDHGIQGLRDIAEPMGIKGRSIVELIDEILAGTDLSKQ